MTPPQERIEVRFPRDSNLNYLPFMYFLPEDLIAKFPTLRTLPRCLGVIARSQKLMDLIASDQFFNEIMDASAALVFPHFGFGGWKEHYTIDCPVWKFSYYLPLWNRLLKEETGWGLQALMTTPSTRSIPFFAPDYIKKVMERVVKRGIAEENVQPILDVVREMPCDEDFEQWDTNVRKDFLRKWYHTRSKKVQTVSLEACMEDEAHSIHEMVADTCDVAEIAAANDFAERFKARLSMRDGEILELRMQGFKYKEIGEKLGYKNPSGVIKRMQAITQDFIKYEETEG